MEEIYEKHETKVEVVEDFEAYEEMHTVITESVRSGSLTSLEGKPFFFFVLLTKKSLSFRGSVPILFKTVDIA